jgi:predicted RNA-binding Zn ribbon-like protein
MRYDSGAGWLDLLATVGGRFGSAPIEHLDGPERLAEWLAHQGLAPAVPPTEADLAAARELRAALAHVVFALLDGVSVPSAALDLVQDYAARDRPPRLRAVRRELRVLPPDDGTAALARVARQAVDQLAGPVRDQLGACADEECRMVYLDPGGRRRWCAANRCGVKARVRAHRQRASDQ